MSIPKIPTPHKTPRSRMELTPLAQLSDLAKRTERAMRQRLYEKYYQGRRGWKTNITDLLERLDRANYRRDFLDAAILAAMLYDFQQRNSQKPRRKGASPC